jgi:hypothetical protein
MVILTKHEAFMERETTYKIYIDDDYCGDISGNEAKQWPVENGNHTIYAKINWCRSNTLPIIVSNAPRYLTVSPRLTNRRLAIIFVCAMLAMLIFSYFSYSHFIRNLPPHITTADIILGYIEDSPNADHLRHSFEAFQRWQGNEAGVPYHISFTRYLMLRHGGVLGVLLRFAGFGLLAVIATGIAFVTIFRRYYLQIKLFA